MNQAQQNAQAEALANSPSIATKIMLLRSRYRSTKDLWLYMTERRKYPLLSPFCFSWISDALSQTDKTLAYSRYPLREEEGSAYRQCSKQNSAQLAIASGEEGL